MIALEVFGAAPVMTGVAERLLEVDGARRRTAKHGGRAPRDRVAAQGVVVESVNVRVLL